MRAIARILKRRNRLHFCARKSGERADRNRGLLMFHARSRNRDFTPAIPLLVAYDPIVGLLAGEGRWRAELLKQLAPCASDVIADVGCGTGSQLTLVGMTSP